jgi:hypothetical protein
MIKKYSLRSLPRCLIYVCTSLTHKQNASKERLVRNKHISFLPHKPFQLGKNFMGKARSLPRCLRVEVFVSAKK